MATQGPTDTAFPDPWGLPLDNLDPSRAELFEHNVHGEYFRRLRQEAPVHYTRESPFGAYWSITKYHDIVAVEKNYQVFSSEPTIVIGDPPPDFITPMFISMDPPKHDVQRMAVIPAVGAARVKELEALIRERAGVILDGLPRNETFNWVDRVAKELTTQMLATLFDFPWEDRHLLTLWSDVATTSETVGSVTDMAKRQQVLGECLAYFARLWQERAAAEPKFDFISLLAHHPGTRDLLSTPMEFLGNMLLLIVGGNDPTRNSISGGLLALNQNPDQYELLQANPGLITNMASEIIRWQTPASHMRRTAREDIEFQGKRIHQGDRVVMWYVSGNRDEAVFENPEAFNIERKNARDHLSFGFGIHRCLGSRVAEMQLKIWLFRFECG
ncbi:MAG: cytochrome P450 [Gammaproteobacteria bacterium]|nr:cytochrome P450 [Gammaproteobacteria bacterium]